MKKRPGTSDDRDVLVPKHDEPLVPRNEFAQSRRDFTPVRDVIDRIERVIVLDDRDRLMIQLFWEHTANMTMRWEQTDTAKFGARLDTVEDRLIEKFGVSGKNGDFSALKERVDKAEARRWWAITFLAGLIVTTVGWAYSFGSRIGSLESDVETLKARSYRARGSNSFPPDFPATKETP